MQCHLDRQQHRVAFVADACTQRVVRGGDVGQFEGDEEIKHGQDWVYRDGLSRISRLQVRE